METRINCTVTEEEIAKYLLQDYRDMIESVKKTKRRIKEYSDDAPYWMHSKDIAKALRVVLQYYMTAEKIRTNGVA